MGLFDYVYGDWLNSESDIQDIETTWGQLVRIQHG